jgi:hypothetical protein
MLRRIAQLLLFIAVLLAPLSMTAAPASSATHAMAPGVGTEHCPDQEDGGNGSGGIAECTMACAAALPALPGPLPAPFQTPVALEIALPAAPLSGLHPEIATPPPKRA